MKNKKYYSLWVLTLALLATFISCEEDGDVRDGIRDVSFKATAKNRNITEGGTITYIDSSTNVTSRLWTFAEGSIPTSDQATVDVDYPTGQSLNEEGVLPGYLTSLSVTHDDGTVEEGKFLVRVYNKVTADFSSEETEVIVGTSTTFTSVVENLQSLFEEARENDGLEWTFEGGTPATSTAENPTVTYNTLGTYKVTLTAHRESPLSETTKTVDAYITVVEPTPVVAAFSADNSNPAENVTVTYSDDSAGAPDEWLWTFEGGTPETSTEENPIVTYAAAGTYSVTLQSTRVADGMTDTITTEDFVTVTGPDPNFIIRGGVDADFATLNGWDLQTPPTANTPEEDYGIVTTDGVTALRIQAGASGLEKNTVFRTADLGELPAGNYTFTFRYMLEGGDRTLPGALELRTYVTEYGNDVAFGPPAQVYGAFKLMDWTLPENIGVWQETSVNFTVAAPIAAGSVKLQLRIGPAHANTAVVLIDNVSLEAAD